MDSSEFNYDEAVEIADGIFWVGYADVHAGFHCNPYLIVDNDEAVLIDSGSRNDFSTVMLKIMRTGTNPRNIKRLIYQHYDPDLCGNIPHMEAIIDNPDLKLISHRENIVFIKYYSVKSPMQCIEKIDNCFEFSSGRRLEFIHMPYCHSPGSFMTYDTKTKVIFTSDVFGAYDANWSFYTHITENCTSCAEAVDCIYKKSTCQMNGLIEFHKRIMPSKDALNYALDRVEEKEVAIIAPQHGSIHNTHDSITAAIMRLRELKKIGFEYHFGSN